MTAPHVNHALLQRYVGRRVQLVGEVVSIESGVVKMRTSDDKEVVIRTLPSSMQYGRYVCFTGTWSAQGVMDEISHSNWSDDFGKRGAFHTLELCFVCRFESVESPCGVDAWRF